MVVFSLLDLKLVSSVKSKNNDSAVGVGEGVQTKKKYLCLRKKFNWN